MLTTFKLNYYLLSHQEPTSGLDSSTAYNLLLLLKNYAVKEKKTVILTIHQPSSQIFYLFDNLLLLANGKCAYFGNVRSVVDFFAGVGFHMSPHYNPADFIMEKVKGSQEEVSKLTNAAEKLLQQPNELPENKKEKSSSSSETAVQTMNDNNVQLHDSNESHLWARNRFQEHLPEDQGLVGDVELRVVIDCHHDGNLSNSSQQSSPNHSQNHSSHPHGHHHDYDSGRSSLTDMDRNSTHDFSSSSSTSSCSEEMYFDFSDQNKSSPGNSHSHSSHHHHHHHHQHHHLHSTKKHTEEKWATCFWTQLQVLTARNFYESRGRMLSKLNFIQTIVLAIVTGSIWYQIPREESTLNDVRGWMFFSMTYWMLFALFNALVSFPSERLVVNKERASGSYRLSAYYLAKMIGELPLTIVMPSLFHFISYPLMGCSSVQAFLCLWLFQILSSLVAQSVGLLVGSACLDLEVSITVSALYSMSSILFGGFYSATMPFWLNWMRFLSIVYYSFQNMQMIEYSLGASVE